MDNEKELKDLTDRVIAAGGRVSRQGDAFLFDIEASENCKRGDEHRDVKGLYFWERRKGRNTSTWLGASHFAAKGEREAEKTKRWAQNNPEKANLKSKKWREANPGKMSRASRSWKEANRHKVYSSNARRRAKLREALDPTANQAIIESRYAAQEHLGQVTGVAWHVDHTQPLSRGGKDHEDNLQVVPQEWNTTKGARHNNRWEEDSDRYRLATEIEKRFEREAIAAQSN